MKNLTVIFIISLLLMAGCGGNRKSDDLITVDVTANYPQIELNLQDVMDVEYIALETTDDFLCQGLVLDVGKEMILVRNLINDGDIFIFNRKGKAVRKINRMGQSGEDYVSYGRVMLDEENNEIFIDDWRKIVVYDLYGKFLRSFPKAEGTNYSSLQNFDREHLIGRETTVRIDENSTASQPFAIISKKDGSMIKDIRIRFKQGINPTVVMAEMQFAVNVYSNVNSITPFHNSRILTELSSDTIFRLFPDYRITPFMTRTPPIHSMNPELFLLPEILTDRYYFLEILKKEVEARPGFFPRTKLVYDKQEKATYRYTVNNDDYSTKKPLEFTAFSSNNEIAFRQKLEAHELIELNRKGELKGKLKEVATELDDDSNPVIMLVKYKK